MSSSTQRNQQDVDLASETLEFLNELDAATANGVTDMRSLVVNLCDMQARFATPMAMPFGGNDNNNDDKNDDDDDDDDEVVLDMKQRLDTPRPFELLQKYHVVYKCPPECLVEDPIDCARAPDGSLHVFCGGDSWEKLVERGLISGDDAKPPNDSVWLWLPELFKLFAAVAERHPRARRLAAAWFYTATEVDLSNDSDDDDDDAVAAAQTAAPAANADDDDEEGDEDDDDDDGEGDEFVPEDDEEDEEIDDDADGDDAVGALTDMADAMVSGGRENAIEALGRMMSAAAAGGETVSAAAFEPPEARAARETILKAVDQMRAYLPSPDSHMPFFKRVLKKINTGGCAEWFPWGAPPLQHMVDLLTKDMADNEQNNFMRESLTVFAQAQN